MADLPGGSRWRYGVDAFTSAPPDAVWPLVGEVARWTEWSFLTRSYLLQEGRPAPDGVGALRRLARGPFGSTEEVVVWEPPHHLAYVARTGMPARRYRADIVLQGRDGGTAISWTGSLEPVLPGTGGLVLAYARGFVRLFARELVRFADSATS